jgi:hypothetical protein
MCVFPIALSGAIDGSNSAKDFVVGLRNAHGIATQARELMERQSERRDEIDYQFEPHRLFNRQVAGRGSHEDASSGNSNNGVCILVARAMMCIL